MIRGWVRIDRKIFDSWIWKDKPFSKGQAWIDLIMLASHEDKKFLLGNELIHIKRGEFITSEVKLSDRWGWSRTKVRDFLKLLESDKMLVKKSDNKKTSLTIVNYSAYQDIKTTKEQQKNIKKTSKEHQKNTINNDKQLITTNNKKDMSPSAKKDLKDLPVGAELLPDGTISYANVKRNWD